MYVRPISMRFVRGRSTPEIRAMLFPLTLTLLVLLVGTNHAHNTLAAHHLALVANLLNRRSDLHSRFSLYNFSTIRPRPGSFGINATRTRSPTITRTKLRPTGLARCAVTWCRPASSTRTRWLGNSSRTTPSDVLSFDSLSCSPSLTRSLAHPSTPLGMTLSLSKGQDSGPRYADTRSSAFASSGASVNTRQPSSVTTTVCSKCADNALSFVTAVQP